MINKKLSEIVKQWEIFRQVENAEQAGNMPKALLKD